MVKKTKIKSKVGRKSKVAKISSVEVKKLAAIGCTQQEIADFFGVAKSQISRNFATAYMDGLTSCKMSLRRWQLKSAKKSVDMQKWLGKQILGQHEPKQEFEHGVSADLKKLLAELDGQGKGLPKND